MYLKQTAGIVSFFLEDMLMFYAARFFVGYDLLEARAFRITRDADLYIDEEDAQDLVVEVERQLKKRQRGQAVRLEFEVGTSRFMRRFMTQEMNLEKEDMYQIDGPLDMTVFFGFCGIKGYNHLRYPEAHPHSPWSMLEMKRTPETNIFDMIREKDLLIHLPYESFDESVVNFLYSAAMIKMCWQSSKHSIVSVLQVLLSRRWKKLFRMGNRSLF